MMELSSMMEQFLEEHLHHTTKVTLSHMRLGIGWVFVIPLMVGVQTEMELLTLLQKNPQLLAVQSVGIPVLLTQEMIQSVTTWTTLMTAA